MTATIFETDTFSRFITFSLFTKLESKSMVCLDEICHLKQINVNALLNKLLR